MFFFICLFVFFFSNRAKTKRSQSKCLKTKYHCFCLRHPRDGSPTCSTTSGLRAPVSPRTARSDATGGCLKDADSFKTALELPWLFPPQKIIISRRLCYVAFVEPFDIYKVLLCTSALPARGIIIIAITATVIIIIMDLL